MRHLVSAGLFTIALLCIAAAVAIVWRESQGEHDENDRATIAADFVGHCQTPKPDCATMVEAAMQWALSHHRIDKDCLAHRPSVAAMARGAVIWLNAHPQFHPLPADEALTRAADAIWPCRGR